MKSKFKFLLAAAALASLTSTSRAQMLPGIVPVPLGYCQLSASTLAAATGLSSCASGIPAGANMILMQSEAQVIRWRDDGPAPTTTVGMELVNTASVPTVYNGTLSKIQFIDAVAGGILDVSFYKVP